jgi:hypothetical protein
MNESKLLFFAAAGLLSSPLFGQSAMTAQKSQEPSPAKMDFYGSLEFKQAEIQYMENGQRMSTVSILSVAPTFGLVFWEKKVDTSFSASYGSSNQADKIQTFEAYNETLVNLYKSENFAFGPYSFTDFSKTSGTWMTTDLGVNLSGDYKVPLSYGGLSLSAFTRPRGQVMSSQALEDNKKAPKNNTGVEGFGLDDPEDAKVRQRDFNYLVDNQIALKFVPSIQEKLTLALSVDVLQSWVPQYQANGFDSRGNPDTEFDAYQARMATVTRTSASYQLTEMVKVKGELRSYMGGFYGYALNAATAASNGEITSRSIESRFTVSADLF